MSTRRGFLKTAMAMGIVSLAVGPACHRPPTLRSDKWFDISLTQWSLNRAFFSNALSPMDFAKISKREFGIGGVEYLNRFYEDGFGLSVAHDLKMRADDEGVINVLIMCSRLGLIGDPDAQKRAQTVEKHKIWIEAAQIMGCHSIRVNAHSRGAYDEQMKLAADGLFQLAEIGKAHGINVIVENHGGLSNNGAWLAGVMKQTAHDYCGTLPDFGNFFLNKKTGELYDRYLGVEELMPFAKAVSAKSYDFNDAGEETSIDYPRMLQIVKEAGYRGHIGIEYTGKAMNETEGILATKHLLQALGGR